jgi:hypothetical protein
MKGDWIVTAARQGWGNRKTGCEAYGPLGRWAGPIEMPNRRNENVLYGDLLGDHLDECGAGEGSPLIVIASTSRFDTPEFDELREAVTNFVAEWWAARAEPE